MKVAILARGLDRPGGVARLLSGYLSSLPPAAPDWQFFAITDSPLPEYARADNLHEVLLPRSHPAVFDHIRLPRAVRRLSPDVFLATKNTLPVGLSCPAVCVYLDLAYFAYPQAYRTLDNIYMRAMFRRSAHRATRIITISSSTRDDVGKFLSREAHDKARVVYPGLDTCFRMFDAPEKAAAGRRFPRLPKRFVLYAGNISPRKNLVRLIDAFQEIDASVGLVMTGHRTWKSALFDAALEKARHKREMMVLGPLSDEDLCALYNLAEAVVYPSLYEGFGFPVLESFACGTPVAASRRASIPEVAGDAALLFDPLDAVEISEALGRILRDAELADDLRQRGILRAQEFTWRRCAEGIVQVLQEAV